MKPQNSSLRKHANEPVGVIKMGWYFIAPHPSNDRRSKQPNVECCCTALKVDVVNLKIEWPNSCDCVMCLVYLFILRTQSNLIQPTAGRTTAVRVSRPIIWLWKNTYVFVQARLQTVARRLHTHVRLQEDPQTPTVLARRHARTHAGTQAGRQARRLPFVCSWQTAERKRAEKGVCGSPASSFRRVPPIIICHR